MLATDKPSRVAKPTSTPLGAGGWAMASYIISYAIGAVIFIPLARFLNPTDFGLYTEATVYYAGLTVMVELPLIRAIVRATGDPAEAAQTVLGLAVVMGLAGAVLCAALGWPLALIYNSPQLIAIMPALSLAVIATALGSIPMALLWRELNFRRKVLPDVISIFIGAGVALVTALAGFGVYSLILYSITRAVANAIVAWLVVDWRPVRRWPSWAAMRTFLPFVGPASGGELALHARFNMDFAIGGAFLGSSGLGIYTLAWDSADKPAKVINSFFDQVGFATFARLQANRERVRRIYLSATRLLASVTLPLFLSVLFVRQDLVNALLGAKWQDVISPMLPLFILQALWIVFHPASGLVLALGHSRVYAAVNTISLIGTVGAVVTGAMLGVTGLAWAMTISSGLTSLAWGGLALLYLRPPRSELWQTISLPLALTLSTLSTVALTDGITNAVHLPALLRLLLTVGAGGLVFAAVGWRCWPALQQDLARLREALPPLPELEYKV